MPIPHIAGQCLDLEIARDPAQAYDFKAAAPAQESHVSRRSGKLPECRLGGFFYIGLGQGAKAKFVQQRSQPVTPFARIARQHPFVHQALQQTVRGGLVQRRHLRDVDQTQVLRFARCDQPNQLNGPADSL
jgi:hypothetical protein